MLAEISITDKNNRMTDFLNLGNHTFEKSLPLKNKLRFINAQPRAFSSAEDDSA